MMPGEAQGYPEPPRPPGGKLGSLVTGKAGPIRKSWGQRGPFQKHPMTEVGHFLVKGRVANLALGVA